MEIDERVRKTMILFNDNLRSIKEDELSKKELEVVEMAKMYASDAEAWVKKGDYVTAFSGIEYAHGLLDAIRKIRNADG